MELMKEQICLLKREKETTTQFTVEEDYNVPDQKPDMGRIIQYDGKIKIDEVKAGDARVYVTGLLKFKILYAIDRETGKVDCLDGELSFHEMINLDGITSGDKICLKWEMEDLDIRLIHSRKMSIRSIITFRALKEKERHLALPTDLREDGISQKKEKKKVLGLHVHSRDTIRIREEYTLSSNKPDVSQILWDSVDVRAIDVRAENGRSVIKGELFAFVLYEDANESQALQWLEFSVPFQKELICEGCDESMIPELDLAILSAQLSVKPDADGEERIIFMDVVLESDLKVYEEGTYEVLLDVYHPAKEYIPRYEKECLEQLLVKNYAKCRVQDRVRISDRAGRILQICHSDGDVHIEESRSVKEGILVEGFVRVRILYITGEDDMPFYSTETNVPFSMTVEAEGMDDTCKWHLHTDLEQLSTTMVDGSEIEVKVLINLNALVLRQELVNVLEEIEVHEPDYERIKNMPGIVGYVVQPGDSLWDIAKRYYTSVEMICTINELHEQEVQPGDTLILVKELAH